MSSLTALREALGMTAGEQEAVAELQRRALSDRRQRDIASLWDQWMRWRVVNRLSPFAPGTDRELRRYLHLHRDRWGWGAMTNIAIAVARGYVELGFPSPSGPLTASYLATTRRIAGTRVEVRPVDAVRPHDAQRMAAVPPEGRVLETARRTAALLLGREGELSPDDLLGVGPAQCRKVDKGWVVDASSQLVIERAERPALADALDVAVAGAEGDCLFARSTKGLRGVLRRWANRAGVLIPTEPYVGAELTEAEVEWLLFLADQHVLAQLRDRLAVLVNGALGRRAIDLGRLEFRTSRYDEADGRWLLLLNRQKNDPMGQGEWLDIGHVDEVMCAEPCPACHLLAWQQVVERLWPTYEGPIFPARLTLAGPTGRLSTEELRLAMKDLWVASGGDPTRRIGSRSSRVGVATAAFEAGMTPAEVAGYINHRSLHYLELYLRREAFGRQLRLCPEATAQ